MHHQSLFRTTSDALSTIITSTTNVIVSVCGFDKSIGNLVSASDKATAALDITAGSLLARTTRQAEHEAKLAELEYKAELKAAKA